MRVFFISDTHFGHRNIIKYESRPFDSSYQMDEHMIKVWNDTVGKDDLVYHLGDFALDSKQRIAKIVSRLNGRKRLVLGNHDKHSYRFYSTLFERVYDKPIIYREFYFLSHEPLYLNDKMPYVNIHGHLHSKTINCNHFNASVECIGYRPMSFDCIVKVFKLVDRQGGE